MSSLREFLILSENRSGYQPPLIYDQTAMTEFHCRAGQTCALNRLSQRLAGLIGLCLIFRML